MSHLQSNLNSLNSRYPFLYESLNDDIKKYDPKMYLIEKSREGSPTLQIDGNYIHSKFDPQREADRYVNSEISREAGLVVFAGFGLAYHIERFLDQYPEKEVLVIEPDRTFFVFSLSCRDLSKIITSERVQFLIGTKPEDCSVVLEKFPGKTVQLVKLRSIYNKDQVFYDDLDKYIRNYISRKEINLSTLKRFGKLWVRNLSANAGQLSQSPGIFTLENTLAEFPALLIAAGPSLDRIKDHLKELQKKFLIISVDTALRACLEAGVEPDFTVVVDPQYWNSRHLDRCVAENTILLSETSTYPSVFRQIVGKTFLCSSSFPLGLYMEDKTEIKGKLKAGGSVATAAWDFCRKLSIQNIWCAGLDLGFPDKQTHCKGSFFEQRAHWLSERRTPSETFSWHALIDAGLTKIESNSGNVTWTDKRMSVYSRWFEEQMSYYKNIETWNLSDEGIKIEGMPRKTLEEALDLPEIRNELNRQIEQIKKIEVDNSLSAKLDSVFDSLLHELNSLNLLSEKGIIITGSLEESFYKGKDIQPILNKLSVLDNEILHSLSKEIAGFILQNFISNLLNDDHKKNPDQIIKNSFQLYKELQDSTVFHIELLEISKKNIKNT